MPALKNSSPHSHSPHTSLPTPDARFNTIHIDLVGPLPPSRGYNYLLTCVDRFTRWPEAFPLTSITAEAVAHTFVSGWIVRFGVPSTIITDRGWQFESTLWQTLMTFLVSKRVRTTSYHPQANGMVESFHRQLKSALKAHPQSWMDALPLVMLGIRTALKEDLHLTAAEMVYGTTLRIPGAFFTSSPDDSLPDPINYVNHLKTLTHQLRPSIPRLPTRKSYVSKELSDCTHVFIRQDAVRKPLQPPYNGPYRVVERKDKFFVLDIHGHKDTVSLDRLKPAYLDLETEPMSDTQLTSPPPPTSTPVSPPTSSPPLGTTRSGRHVHWPDRLYSYV